MSNNIKWVKTESGSGTWYTIHQLAYNSQSIDDQKTYCKNVRIIASGLPCTECRHHAMDYIKINSPEKYISSDPKSMFKWSCEFHNNANNLTHKSIMDWNVMYDLYSKNAPIYNDSKISDIKQPRSKAQEINQKIFETLLNK